VPSCAALVDFALDPGRASLQIRRNHPKTAFSTSEKHAKATSTYENGAPRARKRGAHARRVPLKRGDLTQAFICQQLNYDGEIIVTAQTLMLTALKYDGGLIGTA
jgi:hypothetical protein